MDVRRLKAWAGQLKADTYALYLASTDPRVPWYAKLLVGEHRATARLRLAAGHPHSRAGAVLVVAVWIAFAAWLVFAVRSRLKS